MNERVGGSMETASMRFMPNHKQSKSCSPTMEGSVGLAGAEEPY